MTAVAYAIGVVLFVIGLIASVMLHEAGHMLSAKAFGVKVTQYFVGFGKTLWSTKKGETEYGVKAIFAGGFVKMIGMLPPEKQRAGGVGNRGYWAKVIAEARAAEHKDIGEEDRDRMFYTRPSWQKLIVMLCGPLTNMLLAVIIFGVVFIGIGVLSPTLTVNRVSDCVIPSSQAGRQCQPSDPVAPAKKAGFQRGDTILAIDGTPMNSWQQLSSVIEHHADTPMTVLVKRDGHRVTLTANPTVNQLRNPNNPDKYIKGGFLGISPTQVRDHKDLGYVFGVIGDYTARTAEALAHLPSKMVGVTKAALGMKPRSEESPMSPVGASRLAGQVASNPQATVLGRVALGLSFLGMVNLFLAMFNFVPLLPLDGGHMAGAVYEWIRRGWAKLRRRPDPGYADVAKMLPVAYAIAGVIILAGVILVWADIFNPVMLPD